MPSHVHEALIELFRRRLGHPDWALRPVVIALDRVPVLTDPEEAVGKPELAVLSAMAHGAGIDGDKVLSAFLAGLRALSDDQANLYTLTSCS